MVYYFYIFTVFKASALYNRNRFLLTYDGYYNTVPYTTMRIEATGARNKNGAPRRLLKAVYLRLVITGRRPLMRDS